MSKIYPRQHSTVVWSGIAGDIALALLKGGFGYISGSKALMADALYSGSDAAAKLTGRISARFSGRRGNGRLTSDTRQDAVITVVAAALMFMGGLQIAFSAIRSLVNGNLPHLGSSALVVVITAMVCRELLFQYQYRYYRRIGDGKLASCVEDHRFSLYSSLIVLTGIMASMAGSWLGLQPLLYMDPIAALLAAGLVIRKGYRMISKPVDVSERSELPEEESVRFIETVQKVRGIIRVEHLKSTPQGNYYHLQITVSVNPRCTVAEAHDISDCARKLLLHRFAHVGEVHLDVVPYDPGYPYKSNYEPPDSEMPTLLQ